MAHVQNVNCPECGRTWTGSFPDDRQYTEAVCKDCVEKNPDLIHTKPK